MNNPTRGASPRRMALLRRILRVTHAIACDSKSDVVSVPAVADRGDFDDAVGVVNKVDDPVRSPPRRPQWRERRSRGLPTRCGGPSRGPVTNSWAAAATFSGSTSARACAAARAIRSW